MFNFLKNLDVVKATFALTFILMAIYVVYPDAFDSTGPIKDAFRVAIGSAACIAGVYLLYRISNTNLFTFNEVGAGGVGMFLLFFGFYMMFGQMLTEMMNAAVNYLLKFSPYAVALVSLLIGMQLVSKGKEERGYILILIGAVVAGMGFLAQYFKWW